MSENKKLEDIGFYTLSDKRAKEVSWTSDLQRCELILTNRCNFKCLYCRGIKKELQGDLTLEQAKEIIDIYGDVYNIIDNRKNKTNEQLNEEILKVLIDKKVVTKESAKKLVDRNKIHINDKSIVE